MHRRTGSGGGNYSSGSGRYGGSGYGGSQMYDRDFMDEMAFRREMMQRGMMGDMGFYSGMGGMGGMGTMGMGGMMMGNMGNMSSGQGSSGNRGYRDNRNNKGGGRGGGNMQGQRRDGNRQGGMQSPRGQGNYNNQGNRGGNMGQRGGQAGQNRGQGGGMQRNRSDPGQGTHQRRLSDMRQDRDQRRRDDRGNQQWDNRRGGPQNLQIKESGPLGKIKAISHRIKEWGNFGHGLPYWTKRANIYRRFSNFLERGNIDHTIVFIGHGSDCVCRLYVDELYLAEGCGASKSEARSDAYYRAVERLRLRNFDTVINKDDKFTTCSLKGYEVDQVISESPSNSITFESNYAQIATSRVADFNYPWDKLVLVERTGMSNAGLKLRLSANLNGMLLEQNTSKAVPPGETKPKWKFAISLENKLLAEAYHDKQGIARSTACLEAMKKLDPVCWRLLVDRHRFPKLKNQRDDRRKGNKDEQADKSEEKKGDETKKEKEDTTDLDTTAEKHDEEEAESQEDSDEPFVPPEADLRRSDLVDPEEAAKDEEKDGAEEEKEAETEEKDGEEKEEAMEEGDEAKEGDAKKDEESKAEQKLKQKIEAEAKQRKKAEFLFKIRKALEEKLTAFAAKRNYGQLVLEGFWMEERDHVIRLCRKLNMRSYVDKYRNDESKIVHFIFVSQIIPMEELFNALKKAKGMKLGVYTLLKPKTKAEIEAEEAKREEERVKREEAYEAKRKQYQKDKEEKEAAKKASPKKEVKKEVKSEPKEES